MEIKFSIHRTARTFGIELRERSYPKFEGKYNAYVAVYGQLTGDYLGSIPEPLAMDIAEDEAINLIPAAEALIAQGYKPVIW